MTEHKLHYASCTWIVAETRVRNFLIESVLTKFGMRLPKNARSAWITIQKTWSNGAQNVRLTLCEDMDLYVARYIAKYIAHAERNHLQFLP